MGRGLKFAIGQPIQPIRLVASHTWGEDWNDFSHYSHTPPMRRLTYVGRGLKFLTVCIFLKVYTRRLTYVGRGLKLTCIDFHLLFYLSPHIRGARIEIAVNKNELYGRNSRLTYVGRGLKYPPVMRWCYIIDVASHTWGEDWNFFSMFILLSL